MKNLQRGPRFVPVDPSNAKLMMFNNGNFADNRNSSSQLECILTLVNEMSVDNTFNIYGDLIYWSSIKCKSVTLNIFASEIYGMVGGFDLGIAIKATLRMVTDRLNIPSIPLVIFTDSSTLGQISTLIVFLVFRIKMFKAFPTVILMQMLQKELAHETEIKVGAGTTVEAWSINYLIL